MKTNYAAHILVGKIVGKKWFVEEKIESILGVTSTVATVGYFVRNSENKQKAFLKVIDMKTILDQPEFGSDLRKLLNIANHEKEIMNVCINRKMNRVIQILDYFEERIQGAEEYSGIIGIVMELAKGDTRQLVDLGLHSDMLVVIGVCHDAAVGMMEMHKAELVHRDFKASNVMLLENGAKVGDVGSASKIGITGPFDDLPYAGDPAHRPPEAYEQTTNIAWEQKIQHDLYMLGGVIHFLLTGEPLNSFLRKELGFTKNQNLQAQAYSQSYAYVRHALDKIYLNMELSLKKRSVPEKATNLLVNIVRYLTDADPTLRGHPINRQGIQNKYSLERIVQELDLAKTIVGITK